MTSRYKSGYALERDIRSELRKKGYYVIRSAKSETLCDLIAIPLKTHKNKDILCIQCKKSTVPNRIPYISRKELKDLEELEKRYNVKVILAIRFRLKGRWLTMLLTIPMYTKLRNTIKIA